jgi:hypothetical protein
MEENGFAVESVDAGDLSAVKQQYQVPSELQSCHTAIVDGYVIEGHVPASDVKRLLADRPAVIGLAVPGMPVGSPGMEVPGMADESYEVVAFDQAGAWEVYASYPGE